MLIIIIILFALIIALLVCLLIVFLRKKNNSNVGIINSGGVNTEDLGIIDSKKHSLAGAHTGTMFIKANRIKVNIINLNNRQENTFNISSTLTIGRNPTQNPYDPNYYFIPDDTLVSSIHCRLVNYGGLLMVEDLNSVNKTYLNEHMVTVATPMQDNDRITVGKTTLVIKIL